DVEMNLTSRAVRRRTALDERTHARAEHEEAEVDRERHVGDRADLTQGREDDNGENRLDRLREKSRLRPARGPARRNHVPPFPSAGASVAAAMRLSAMIR